MRFVRYLPTIACAPIIVGGVKRTRTNRVRLERSQSALGETREHVAVRDRMGSLIIPPSSLVLCLSNLLTCPTVST